MVATNAAHAAHASNASSASNDKSLAATTQATQPQVGPAEAKDQYRWSGSPFDSNGQSPPLQQLGSRTTLPDPSGSGSEEAAEKEVVSRSSARRIPSVSQLTPDDVAANMSIWHEAIFVFVVIMSQCTTQIGLTMSLFPQELISESFGITNAGIKSWLIAGYSLTSGTFILVFGRWGDIFGYRNMMIAGYAWFALWSIISGVAVYSNQVLYIWARTLTGLGPAVLMPNAMAIVGATYNAPQYAHRMNFVFSLFGAVAPFGGFIGGLMPSVIAIKAWWPWAFWVFGIFLAGLCMTCFLVLPKVGVPSHSMTWGQIFGDLDFTGSFLGLTGMILFNFAFNQAPVVGWEKAYVYVLLIIGVLFLAGFFYWEIKLAKSPLIPFHALHFHSSFVLGCIVCGWSAFGVWIYYYVQLLQKIRMVSMIMSAVEFIPAPLSGLCAAVLTPYGLRLFGPHRVMLFSMCAFSLGSLLLSLAGRTQSYWGLTFVSTIIQPLGMDTSFPAATIILSRSVPKEHQGVAASLVATLVNYSISIALGIAATVEVHVNRGGTTVADQLLGIRGAMYFGLGISVLGLGLAIIFNILVARQPKPASDPEDEKAVEH